MKKLVLLLPIFFSFVSILSSFGNENQQIELLNEIDYLKIEPENFQAIGIIQNVKTDWGKLGLRGKIKSVEQVVNFSDGETTTGFRFNENGKVTGLIFNNYETHYLYTTRGKLFREYDKEKIIHEYNYDKDNRLKKAMHYPNGLIKQYGDKKRFVFIYDENGQIIQDNSFYINEYDDKGHCIKQTYSGTDKKYKDIKITRNFIYNQFGDITRRSQYIYNPAKSYADSLIVDYTYKYDNKGNWIESTSKSNKSNIVITKRQITYFPESAYLEVEEFDEEPIENPDEIAIFGKEKTDVLYYLAGRIRYPENAAEKRIQGKVIIRFVVTKEGNIANAEVIQSVDPEIDNEAMRVIKSMPKWKPALKNDKTVNSYYSLPVVFKVQQ